MKPRHHIYLSESRSAELEALANDSGAPKSAIVEDALRDFLRQRGTRELDQTFGPRFDRLQRELVTLRRDFDVLFESFAAFVRYELTINPPMPENDPARIAQGRERYREFVRQVGRQVEARQRKIAGGEAEVLP
jgi:Ribbon-helix-helix protein, copG family